MNVQQMIDVFDSPTVTVTKDNYPHLKLENDLYIKAKEYHSNNVKQFYGWIDFMKGDSTMTWTITPFIEQLYFHSLFSQRTAEYALIVHQMSVGIIGINMADYESLYQLYFILKTTSDYLKNKIIKRSPTQLLDRFAPSKRLAAKSEKSIHKILVSLQDPKLQASEDKIQMVGRLGLVNRNLNRMLVVNK